MVFNWVLKKMFAFLGTFIGFKGIIQKLAKQTVRLGRMHDLIDHVMALVH